MVIIFEKEEERKGTLDSGVIEPFTQRKFSELINDAYMRKLNHVIARVKSAGAGQQEVAYYDARHLCKYIFELVISRDGRKVRIKNFSDPLTEKEIKEISFFELKPKSDTPIIAVYVGSQKTFLESHNFRSKIFNRNDPFDALSINFVFKDTKSTLRKKSFIPAMISVAALLLVLLLITASIVQRGVLSRPLASLRNEFLSPPK